MTFTKIARGWYATADGRYAIVIDGYEHISGADREGDGVAAGLTGREWALAFDPGGRLRRDHNAGENLDWFTTKRAAVAAAASFDPEGDA